MPVSLAADKPRTAALENTTNVSLNTHEICVHMQTSLMGMLKIPSFFLGIMLQYNHTQTMLVFVIHTFVLHSDNMFPGGRERKAEINNSDKSCLVRGEKG